LKHHQKHSAPADEPNSASWLTTFNDLVTLLMVFFVLLFSMSTIDVKKMSDFQYALQSGLGVLKEGKQVSVEVKDKQPVKDMSHIHTQAEGATKAQQQQAMQADIESALGSLETAIGIRMTYTEQGARLGFEDSVFFDFGRAEIRSEGYAVLDKLAGVLKKMSYPIRVEGHTDNVPIHTQRFPSNWELSTARAVNVVKHFADAGRIGPQRLSAVGYGESKPLVANDSRQQRAKNRRVEIVLIREGQN